MHTGAHGIMCSLGSKVVQHSDVDVIVLPSGQFAFYLADVGEDVDTVVAFVRVIYGLDEGMMAGDDDGGGGGVRLTVGEVRRAQEVCRGYAEKVKVLKAGMTEALRVLADMSFDVLLALMCGKVGAAVGAAVAGEFALRPARRPGFRRG